MAGTAGAATLEYGEYVQRAHAAQRRGDWQSAASQLAQAINHPDQPGSGAERSAVLMDYGRAVGVLCQFGEARQYLLRAKDISGGNVVSAFDALYELGILSLAQGAFADAADYLSQLAFLVERGARAGFAPYRVADAYEKFATALEATGKAEDAALRRQEALRLRSAGPTNVPTAATATPYGSKCPKG